MKRFSAKTLAVGGLLTGLILLLTLVVQIPTPTGGYVHPGDGAIAFAGLLLGPFAAIAAGIGSALADVLGGYTIFALPTLIIKGGMGLVVGLIARPGAKARNLLAFTLAELLMIGGYFLTECVMSGAAVAVGGLFPNAIQGIAGVVFGMALSFLPLPASILPTPAAKRQEAR